MGRYDATSAAGKIDGIEVIVAEAAKLVGKKATVTIGRVLEGQAFATLVRSADAGEGPITFESEAEKPTRAPARRKPAAASEAGAPLMDIDDDLATDDELEPIDDADLEDGAADDVRGEEADLEELDDDEFAGDELAGEDTAADGTTPAKKRTRRGSRGGRRRRKPAAAGAVEGGAETETETGDEAPDDLAAPVSAAEAAVVEAAETGSNGSVSEKAKAPSRRRTSRIHVPGDAAPAASPEVIHEAVAEAAPDLAEAPETDLEEHEEASVGERKRCRR